MSPRSLHQRSCPTLPEFLYREDPVALVFVGPYCNFSPVAVPRRRRMRLQDHSVGVVSFLTFLAQPTHCVRPNDGVRLERRRQLSGPRLLLDNRANQLHLELHDSGRKHRNNRDCADHGEQLQASGSQRSLRDPGRWLRRRRQPHQFAIHRLPYCPIKQMAAPRGTAIHETGSLPTTRRRSSYGNKP